MNAFIITRAGKHVGVEELRDREVTIGRRKPSGPGRIALDDPTISTNHAVATLVGERWAIRDLGSRNGIQINGHTVPSGRDYLLSPGDKVGICDFTLTFSNAPTVASPKAEAFPSSFSVFDFKKVYAPTDVIGGDFFAHRVLDDRRIAIAIGEALGEGRPMGEVTLACADAIRRLAANGSPARVMADFHSALGSFFSSGRVEMLFGILDGAACDFAFSSAGPITPVVFGASAGPARAGTADPALVAGATPSARIEERRIAFSNGETVLLMTGGVMSASPVQWHEREQDLSKKILGAAPAARAMGLPAMIDSVRNTIAEVESEARFFGFEGVASVVSKHRAEGVRILVPALHRAILDHLDGHDPSDDLTVIGIEKAR